MVLVNQLFLDSVGPFTQTATANLVGQELKFQAWLSTISQGKNEEGR